MPGDIPFDGTGWGGHADPALKIADWRASVDSIVRSALAEAKEKGHPYAGQQLRLLLRSA